MNFDMFFTLAQSMSRPDLAGRLTLGDVATDLFALALGLKRPSSLFKKLKKFPGRYPKLHTEEGTRRKFFRLKEIEHWNANKLDFVPTPQKLSSKATERHTSRLGRPTKAEKFEALRRGMTVKELRRLQAERGR